MSATTKSRLEAPNQKLRQKKKTSRVSRQMKARLYSPRQLEPKSVLDRLVGLRRETISCKRFLQLQSTGNEKNDKKKTNPVQGVKLCSGGNNAQKLE